MKKKKPPEDKAPEAAKERKEETGRVFEEKDDFREPSAQSGKREERRDCRD